MAPVPLGGRAIAAPPPQPRSLGAKQASSQLSLFLFLNPFSLRRQMPGPLEWGFH